MPATIEFTLSYNGDRADYNEIDFYDVSEALIGFQRYLALTTHFILNNEIIVQAPSLKNARIYAAPPGEGSWKFTAKVTLLGAGLTTVAGGIFAVGTADKDTPMGNLGRSVYEYVVKETIGVDVDYEKTIGQKYREEKAKNPKFPDLSQSRLDSLTEKCNSAVKRMHRPIVSSKTAKEADLYYDDGRSQPKITGSLSKETYDYMAYTERDDSNNLAVGRVTSYNVNTKKGRIYIPDEKRPIPFVLSDRARTFSNIDAITKSLSATARDFGASENDIKCFVIRHKSRTGRLKGVVLEHVIDP